MHKTLVGVSLSLAAGAFLSTGGIALRLIEDADGYQILFYRALTLIVCMSVYLVMRHRARLWDVTVAIGPPGLIIAFALGMGATLYVQAILHTSVANTVVILSTSPLLTAFLSWMVLGERASRSTVAAALVALAGVGIMVVDG
ncbi:MAG: EamA family transporter, partial [Chromatiales bacterium]|nr:EamA family transporter [Chromatiales bacterium]